MTWVKISVFILGVGMFLKVNYRHSCPFYSRDLRFGIGNYSTFADMKPCEVVTGTVNYSFCF